MRKLSWVMAFIAIILLTGTVQAQQITTLGKAVPFDLKISQSGQAGQNEGWLFRDIKGSVVVFYFFRSSNLNSVERLADIQALQRKYASQGVMFISVTADSDPKWQEFQRSHEIGYFSIYYWNATVLYYVLGAFSDPYVAIVDPRGVLLWRGAPDARLDQRLGDLVEYTKPPLGDTNWLDGRFRKADQYLTQHEIGKAYSIADRLFRMTRGVTVTQRQGQTVGTSHPMQGRAEALRARCDEAARAWIREAVQLEQQGRLEQAARIMAEIAVRFEDPDQAAGEGENRPNMGGNAQQNQNTPYSLAALEIGRMNGDRNAKKLIREAQDNAKGEKLNDEALGYEDDGYYIDAKRLYEQTVKDYKETQAAKEAQRRLKNIERDKTIQGKIAAQRALDESWRWLSIGEHYAGAEFFDRAREEYQKVIDKHPNTKPAELAKELLAALPAAKKE